MSGSVEVSVLEETELSRLYAESMFRCRIISCADTLLVKR